MCIFVRFTRCPITNLNILFYQLYNDWVALKPELTLYGYLSLIGLVGVYGRERGWTYVYLVETKDQPYMKIRRYQDMKIGRF